MTELLTAAQMRAIEQAAIDSGEVTGLALMERAGQGVVDAIFAEWPALAAPRSSAPAAGGAGGSTPSPLRGSSPEYLGQNDKEAHRAVVLCGPGNNGGDGFVVARLLKELGWTVEVFFYGDAKKLPPDAKASYERWAQAGSVQSLDLGALDAAIERAHEAADYMYCDKTDETINLGPATIYIDALFGTGLTRKFDDELLAISREWTDICYAHGVAIDISSGLCSDSGKAVGGNWFFSKLVVTFEAAKTGHFLPETCYDVRSLKVVSLDLPGGMFGRDKYVKRFTDRDLERDLTGFFQDGLNKSILTHKYAHGHALILSGGVGHGGAARLAARGALRIGAGAVTLGTPPAALIENAAQLNAIMLRKIKDAHALTETLEDKRINALCIGPGLGTGTRESALLAAVLARRGPGLRPVVLDADALTLLAQDETLFARLHKDCILTPHAGEFARLFPDIAERLTAPATTGPAYSKVDATREAAKRAGCVVVFKGPDTVIADPSGQCSINASVYERKAPWLATAGSGDVLAGFITGLLARGLAPMQAAETGAWLHTECALSFGPGLIAEDLPEVLPQVFRDLGL